MKQLLLLLLLIPGLLPAQENPKYLEGAVPVADGKVVFTRELSLPGAPRQAIFNGALAWANERFMPDGEFQSRVLTSDAENGQIACLGQQYLVFTNKTLALDRAVVQFHLTLTCTPGACAMKMSAIRYRYNVGDKWENIPAEEQITDKYTLTKKKDKLIKATGKFRIHTIDLMDELHDGLGKALAGLAAPQQPAAPQTASPAPTPTATATPTPAAADGATLPGYKAIAPDKMPGNIYKMLSENWMLITAGDDNGFNMMTASWGGLGHLYNKPVAFCFINPTRHTVRYMETHDTYTLSFYTETYREALNYCSSHSGRNEDKVQGSGLTPLTTPSGSKAFSEAWMIIECRKMVEQPFSADALRYPEVKAKWGKDLHKMFVGEILRIWVK